MPTQPDAGTLAFPDDARRTGPRPVTCHGVVASSHGIPRTALAIRSSGRRRDLARDTHRASTDTSVLWMQIGQ